jgi:DNA-nicking Smr family endonuclease
MSRKKADHGNKPLALLSALVKNAGITLKEEEPAGASPKMPAKNAKREAPVLPNLREASEEEVFLGAMDGVYKASWRRTTHPSSTRSIKPSGNPELEDKRLMQEAMDESLPISIEEHPEYIEGWVGVSGKRFLPKLRDGLYSIQGAIDLHGLNQIEAREAVEKYIERMSRFHSCCVKIIHGRGINSAADKAALKECVQRVLSTRKMARHVVAYASAQSCDGGVGAVYVLLSRQ